mgnify:FL=1
MIPVKVYNIQKSSKFIIEDDLMPSIFEVGKTYTFDLSHASNFQTHMSITMYTETLLESTEVDYVGEPGIRGAKLLFTPKSIGNRYVYDKQHGLLMGSLLNPLILLKDIHFYDGKQSLEEFATPQLYEFSINEDPVHVSIFIDGIRNITNGLRLEDLACHPCKMPEYDITNNREVLSTARILVRQIRYSRKKVVRANRILNSFGQAVGTPGGLGGSPKNAFV